MRKISLSITGLLLVATVVSQAQVTFTEYPAPSGDPRVIATGPDGNLWFTEATPNKIGRITTAGVVTEFSVSGTPQGITSGPDGNLWFTEYNGQRIGRITTAGAITEFSLPSGGNPFSITTGPDGNLWFTEAFGNAIGKITTAGVISEFPIPTAGSGPSDITVGPDGNMWFTECNCFGGLPPGGQIGRITTAGIITEFPLPSANSEPRGIAVGSDGNLWFCEEVANKIGKITTTGVITEYPVPTANSSLISIAAGPDGNLWFTEYISQIGRITTAGVITEFPVPTPNSQPSSIVTGPDGNLWFTEENGNNVAKVSLIIPPVDMVGPVTSNVSVAPDPLPVNTGSSLSAAVSDAMTGGNNIASAYYSINGATSYQMLLTPSGAVTTQASASLVAFSQSNVYNICVYGTDSAGNTGANACIPLPVYDPTGGFVTGGGQVASPAGADLVNTSAAGLATFGFVSKYLPGKNTPSGNLEFQFKNGNLNFNSISMDWLVVTGEPRAKFHGIGTVNGTYTCNFEVDAWAGSFTGNVDAFGLKISSCSNGGDRYSLPATALTKGSIIIHK